MGIMEIEFEVTREDLLALSKKSTALVRGILVAGDLLAFVFSRKGKNRQGFKTEMGKWRVSIAPDAVLVKTEHYDTHLQWSDLGQFVLTDEHAFIDVNVYSSPNSAIIIPRRAFSGDAEFTGFVEAARQYHLEAAARRKAPPS